MIFCRDWDIPSVPGPTKGEDPRENSSFYHTYAWAFLYAHTAAIKEGGYTIAVLGNGPEICYPKEHERLYEEISKNGCILSEYPPGTEPREYHFPKRNRLIAALSDRLYVIDAGRISGTKTTTQNAVKYGREVYALE